VSHLLHCVLQCDAVCCRVLQVVAVHYIPTQIQQKKVHIFPQKGPVSPKTNPISLQNDPISLHKSPITQSKKTCIFVKDPHVSAKEPYISAPWTAAPVAAAVRGEQKFQERESE